MAQGSKRYYRAGHWVERGSGSRRPAKKSWVVGAVAAVALIAAIKIGLFPTSSAKASTPKTGTSASAVSTH